MTLTAEEHKTVDRSSVLDCLADRRRREILRLLQDRVSPVSERKLAIHLTAATVEKSMIDVTSEELQTVRIDLRHRELPTLEEADLVEWDRDEDTVTTTGHPAFCDPRFQQIIETEAPDWDAVVANLAERRRRIVLSALVDHDGELSRRELVREIAARETDSEARPSIVTLHHLHLPKLADAGLIEYHPDDGTVSYEGHPELADEWLRFAPGETPRSVLAPAQHSDDIWSVEGRENVIEHGRSLIEQAEDELFLMFTTDGLPEEEFISIFEDAVERGVDVYLGAQTQEVRDIARERVPEAVIWEPQLDWLNFPPDRERVGRLVFADREAIMLATLGEKTDSGVHEETAITGVGDNNALVVLMREMLGARLDHLDAQSEDFRSQIPL